MHSAPLYEYQPSFILGFHGCDEDVGMRILCGPEEHLKPSEKKYDWLGHGIYFWEGNVARAWEWSLARRAEGKIKKPFVLGAIIDLKHCLDLFDRTSAAQLVSAHKTLKKLHRLTGMKMPKNVGHTPDKLGRALDCSVVNTLHELRKEENLEEYDSVRGAFLEGKPVYPGGGFRSHTHIQICVRNPNCIKGYFKPIGTDGFAAIK